MQLGGSVVPQMNCYAPTRAAARFETHVRAQRQREEVTRHTLSQAELTTVPGTFGDPLRVIQNLPGVARIPFGLGQLVVRGAAPQDSSVFVDGQRVPILYHFLGGPSVLTPNLIDKIDFYPGGFGVHYGRATAGILDVTTKTDAGDAAARQRRHQPARFVRLDRRAAGRRRHRRRRGAPVVHRSAAAAA